MVARQQQPEQDTTTWRFGPLWGAVNGLLVAVLAAQVTSLFGLPLWTPAAVAGAGMFLSAGMWLHTRLEQRRTRSRERIPVRVLMYAAGCMGSAGGWATWTAATTPALLVAYGSLAGGTIALVSVGPIFAPTVPDDEPQPAPVPPPAAAAEDPLVVKWRGLLNQTLNIKNGSVNISRIAHWDGRTGYTVHGEFPLGLRATYKQLGFEAEGLAGALRLPDGCPIMVESGPHQGSFVLKVSTVNDLDKIYDFPMGDIKPRSVADMFPIGKCRDGSLANIELHQSSAIVIGMRGTGKTVVLHSITAHLVQCTNAVVWIADLNGGSMGAPWTAPYANGTIQTPVVDWVATSPEEAIRMFTVGLAIAKDRKARYQYLLNEHNVDVLPASADVPAILIIVDEGAEMFGEDASEEAERAATMARELQRIGRAMLVGVVLSSMRGTRDCVPAAVKKLTDVKIAMRCDDDSELAYLFDWSKGLRVDDLTAKGAGFFRYAAAGAVAPENFKGWRLLPNGIAEIAVRTEKLRPTLDEPAQLVGGATYAQRWTRDETWDWLQALAGTGQVAVRPPDVEAKVRGELPVAVMAAGLEQFAEQFRRDMEAQTAGTVDAAPAVAHLKVVEETAVMQQPEPTETLDEFILRTIYEAGGDGIQTADVIESAKAAGFTSRRQTVHEAIARAAEDDLVVVPKGKWAKWTATDKLRDRMQARAQAA